MAKPLSASEMLGRTKRTEIAKPLDVSAPSRSDDTRPAEQHYERTSVFLTPDQRRWLKSTVRSLPVEGLSGSDVMRLAIQRLRAAVDEGLPLVEELITQAHAEAEHFTGRRNRGLPQRLGE
jgi:hypothetical protein